MSTTGNPSPARTARASRRFSLPTRWLAPRSWATSTWSRSKRRPTSAPRERDRSGRVAEPVARDLGVPVHEASNLFDQLGVWSRAHAIVFARDHGFSG